MGPLWDFDLGFGNLDYSDAQHVEGWWVKYNSWLNRLLDDPSFVLQVQDRFKNHYLPNKQSILEKIDSKAEMLNLAQQENFEKWQILGVQVWPNRLDRVFDTYEEEVSSLKQWYESRMSWLDQAIGSLNGGTVTPENISVTFKVDMSALEVNSEGVYLAGGDFGQEGFLMTNDGAGVWSKTVEVKANNFYLYKFRNQPSYGTWEGFESGEGLAVGGCASGQWNDRFINAGTEDIILNIVAYGSCTEDPY
jgi:hypothetical protein